MKPQLMVMPIKKMLDWVSTREKEHFAVLVAASYDLDPAKLPHKCVVEMFDDIDLECAGRSITEVQAKRYASFVQSLPGDTEIIVCACNAGESRSAALCAALCEYFEVDSTWMGLLQKQHGHRLNALLRSIFNPRGTSEKKTNNTLKEGVL